ASLLQELFITRRSLEVIVDLFFMSLMTVIVFGFVSRFLVGALNANTGLYLLLGMVLWEIVRVNQYSLSVGSLWNIWSRNLSNMFIAPLSVTEYVAAHMLSGLIKTVITFGMICTIAAYGFHFNVLRLGLLNLVLFFVNLTVFAWAVGLVLLGVIFLAGTRIRSGQALRRSGFRRCWGPSPRKLDPRTAARIARPGNVATHQYSNLVWPAAIIAPHSGAGGMAPSPMNERAAVRMIAFPISRVPFTTTGGKALGSTCRRSTRQAGPPRARAASTES